MPSSRQGRRQQTGRGAGRHPQAHALPAWRHLAMGRTRAPRSPPLRNPTSNRASSRRPTSIRLIPAAFCIEQRLRRNAGSAGARGGSQSIPGSEPCYAACPAAFLGIVEPRYAARRLPNVVRRSRRRRGRFESALRLRRGDGPGRAGRAAFVASRDRTVPVPSPAPAAGRSAATRTGTRPASAWACGCGGRRRGSCRRGSPAPPARRGGWTRACGRGRSVRGGRGRRSSSGSRR